MRNGSGKIFIKPQPREPEECLSEITNNVHTKSQVGSQKAERLTQLGSSLCSKRTSRAREVQVQVQNLEYVFSRAVELEAGEVGEDPGSIVRKLTCLNNIFKELKMLKESEIPYQTLRSLSAIQDKFIAIEREILKNTHTEDQY